MGVRWRVLLAACTIGLSFTASAKAAVSYSITEVPGGPNITAINNAGQLTGSLYGQAFLYSDGTITEFGEATSFGAAINNAGQITGFAAVSGAPVDHAFLYSGGSVIDLGSLEGRLGNSYGQAINDLGQVVGQADFGGGTHAFLYEGGPLIDLGTLGGDDSEALGINDARQIVGSSSLCLGPSSGAGCTTTTHAFLYSAGVMTDIGTLGGNYSEATAINASGQITGNSTTAGGAYDGFLYSGGEMLDLGNLGGGVSFSNALNDAGQVVGTSLLADGSFAAFLYSDGSLINLNSLIDPITGWQLGGASGINDAGQIAGYGYLDGTYEGYILTPLASVPEPGSWAIMLAGLGLGGAASRPLRRRSPV